MIKKRQGYVFINRSLQDHYLWTAEPFTKGQAWVDLILYANWKDTQEIDRGEVLVIKRGQFYASDEHWEERWKWSRNKVRKFFKLLEDDGMLIREPSRRRTVITIVNYDVYQTDIFADDTTESTTEGTTESTSEGTTESISEGTQQNNIKNEKNRKKEKSNDDSISNKDNKTAVPAREGGDESDDKLWADEESILMDVFGTITEYTKNEYISLEKKYKWENVLPALNKTKLMGGQTIDYTRTLLEEKYAARV